MKNENDYSLTLILKIITNLYVRNVILENENKKLKSKLADLGVSENDEGY